MQERHASEEDAAPPALLMKGHLIPSGGSSCSTVSEARTPLSGSSRDKEAGGTWDPVAYFGWDDSGDRALAEALRVRWPH